MPSVARDNIASVLRDVQNQIAMGCNCQREGRAMRHATHVVQGPRPVQVIANAVPPDFRRPPGVRSPWLPRTWRRRSSDRRRPPGLRPGPRRPPCAAAAWRRAPPATAGASTAHCPAPQQPALVQPITLWRARARDTSPMPTASVKPVLRLCHHSAACQRSCAARSDTSAQMRLHHLRTLESPIHDL